MGFFAIPIIAPFLEAAGLTSFFGLPGIAGKAAQTAGIANTVYKNLSMDPNISLKGRVLANLDPFGVGLGNLFTKDGKFFDPGFGSPPPLDPLDPSNFPKGGGIPDTPAPPGTGLGTRPPVTVEDLPAPEPFEFGFDPALTTGGPEGQGFGFFNQGGLVSLLPRFQNGGEVSFRQRQRPLGFQAPPDYAQRLADIRDHIFRDVVPSERTNPTVQYLQHQVNKRGSAPMWLGPAAAASKAGLIGGSKFFPPAAAAFSLKDQLFDMPPGSSVRDRVMKFLPEILTKTLGYEKLWPISKKPAPFFDPGFGSPPPAPPGEGSPAPPGEGSPPPPPSPESHAGSLPGIPSEADFSAGFNLFNQGGLVSLLPRRATPVRSPPISYRRY